MSAVMTPCMLSISLLLSQSSAETARGARPRGSVDKAIKCAGLHIGPDLAIPDSRTAKGLE